MTGLGVCIIFWQLHAWTAANRLRASRCDTMDPELLLLLRVHGSRFCVSCTVILAAWDGQSPPLLPASNGGCVGRVRVACCLDCVGQALL